MSSFKRPTTEIALWDSVSIHDNTLVRVQRAVATGPTVQVIQPALEHEEASASEVVWYVVNVAPSFALVDAARKAIHGLLDSRDFLGYQLSHAHGSLSDEQFEAIAEQYLVAQEYPEERLEELASALVLLINERADSDVVSAAFKTDIDAAEKALVAASKRLRQRAVRAHLESDE